MLSLVVGVEVLLGGGSALSGVGALLGGIVGVLQAGAGGGEVNES